MPVVLFIWYYIQKKIKKKKEDIEKKENLAMNEGNSSVNKSGILKDDIFAKYKENKQEFSLEPMFISFNKDLGIDKNELCRIDHSKFKLGETIAVMPTCRHIFHEKCFKTYLLSNPYTCPICKFALGNTV